MVTRLSDIHFGAINACKLSPTFFYHSVVKNGK